MATPDLSAFPKGMAAAALIDTAAIGANTQQACRLAGGADVIAVVKADAYGHGMVPTARIVMEAGASYLGVAHISEGLRLREGGITAPILAWLSVPEDRYEGAIAADIDLGVQSTANLHDISEAASDVGSRARVHLKVDSGLGRGGVMSEQWPQLVEQAVAAQASGDVEVVGIMSHLACADCPSHPSVGVQVARFQAAVDHAIDAGLEPTMLHLANSAGLIGRPDTHFTAVRPGIALYGLPALTDGLRPQEHGFRPAMTLVSRLCGVKDVPAGYGVSYGLTYHTPRATKLGVIPIGYGDGVPRHASGIGPLWINGVRHQVAGRICMDQMVCDLGDAPGATGDPVVLFGPGGNGEPTAHDWAAAIGTIGYEIVTRIGPRVPRIYR